MDRLLVPLDGSFTAEAVLLQVRRFLHRRDARVVLVRVVPRPTSRGAVSVMKADHKAAREYLAGIRKRLEGWGIRVRAVVRMGDPAREILRTAAEERSTLLALTTHGLKGFRRAPFGRVARELLRRTRLPVLLTRAVWFYEFFEPRAASSPGFRRILLALDGRDSGFVRPLMEMAGPSGATFYCLQCGRSTHMEGTPSGRRALKKPAIPVHVRGFGGASGAALLDAVAEHRIDLIAMTTRGVPAADRRKQGIATEYVLRHTRVPLLILQPAGR